VRRIYKDETVRGIVRVVVLALAPLWAAIHTARAQEPAQAQQTYIMGFMLVPWGSDTTAIKIAYGSPMLARASGDSGVVLIYKDAALGKSIFSLFYLDNKKGLVRGVSSIPYGGGTDCETVMKKSRDSILRIYSALTPVEERTQEDPAAPFCEAAAAGKATWKIRWTDPASHNFVSVSLEPEQTRVEIVYQSGSYESAGGS
jgi:hypothetical protein